MLRRKKKHVSERQSSTTVVRRSSSRGRSPSPRPPVQSDMSTVRFREPERSEQRMSRSSNRHGEDANHAKKDPPSPILSGPLSRMNSDSRRSLVLDEETFEDAFLRCMICRDRYDDKSQLPKLLPCHHTFCLFCLQQMVKTETEYRETISSIFRITNSPVTIQCPSCRHGFMTTEEQLSNLSTDHKVVQLLDFLINTNRYTINFCSKHHLQPLNFFCESCILPVCRDCTVLDHKEYKGHIVMDMEAALRKYSPVLEATIRDLESENTKVRETRMALEKIVYTVEQTKRTLVNDVHLSFDRLRGALDEREREVTEICEQGVNKERRKIADSLETASKNEENLQKQCKILRQAKEEGKVDEMFKAHQNIMKTMFLPSGKEIIDESLLTIFNFNHREEGDLLNSITNFGDVGSETELRGKILNKYQYQHHY